jgi:CHAT domain-containing protein/tetratricopeptide (TPR) repeat protein
MPIEIDVEEGVMRLWQLLAGATSWRECASRLVEFQDLLCALEFEHRLGQLALEELGPEGHRVIEAIRRLLHDVRRVGLTDALSERVDPPPLLEAWQLLEDTRGDEELFARWESLLRLPDMELTSLPMQAEALNHAARAYLELGPTPKVALAIEKWEQAIALAGDDPLGVSYRINLGTLLRDQPGAGPRSVEMLHEAVSRMPPNDSRLPEALARLAKSVQHQFEDTPDPSTLQELVRVIERAVDLDPATSLARLSEVSVWMYRGYEKTHDLTMLDGAIELTHLALQRVPEDSPSRSGVLRNLGSAYANRSETSGNLEDLDRAIGLFELAIRCVKGNLFFLLEIRGDLAQALVSRHKRSSKPALLERAVTILEDVVARLPPSHDDYPSALNKLATAISARGNFPQRAVALWEQAAISAPAGSLESHGCRYNVAVAKRNRFELAQDPRDLDQAEEICRALMGLVSDGALAADVRSELATILLQRSRLRRNPALLEEAIELAKRSIELRRSTGLEYLQEVAHLSQLLFNRYEQTRAVDDLRTSLRVAQAALNRPDTPVTARAELLAAAGNCLSEFWEIEGDGSHLDLAIDYMQTAVDSTPAGSEARPTRLNTLAMVLRSRFARNNKRSALLDAQRVSDLDRAIDAAEQATQAADPDNARASVFLGTLSALLKERASLADLCARVRAELAGTVGAKLDLLPKVPGRADDAARAAECSAAALARAPAGSREQWVALNNHGIHLHAEYRATKNNNLLDEGIDLLEQAQQAVMTGPWGAKTALSLARALEDRHERDRNRSDHERASKMLRDAIDRAFSTDLVLLSEALGSLLIKDRQWPAAIQVLDRGINAATQLLSLQSVRSDNDFWLRETHDLWKLAAYARAKHGDLDGAIVTLEEGLARQLREALQMRSFDDRALREAGHDAAAIRHRAAITAWDQVTRETHAMSLPDVRAEDIAARLRATRTELDASIEAIRDLPGFECFQRPLETQQIREAAQDGAIAFVVSMHIETFAIIVPSDASAPLRYLPLPEASAAELMEARGYWAAYLDWSHGQADPRTRARALQTLDESTRWLWNALMGPLIEALGPDRRATLIRTGHLSWLPLHAAWHEDPSRVSGRLYAQDVICFTHAASVGSLAAAQRHRLEASFDRLVAVTDPRPTATTPLAHADIETRTVVRRFASTVLLRHEEATRDALLARLRDCDSLHFSGHGFARPSDPLSSGLILSHDQTLTLGELLQQPRLALKFAFLSACETGVVGFDLPDESIGLPSGLLMAGVAGVCASLWPVPDDSTMLLCSHFYRLWRTEGIESAAALSAAGAWVSALTNADLADFFEAEMNHPDLVDTPAYELAADRWAHYAAAEPNDRPFSHPFYWAAFTFNGAPLAGAGAVSLEGTLRDDDPHAREPAAGTRIHPPTPAPALALPVTLDPRTGARRSVGLADLEELERTADRDGLVRVLCDSRVQSSDLKDGSDEVALLTAAARALTRLSAHADLVAVARDAPRHEVASIIAAQVLAAATRHPAHIETLRTLALDKHITPLTRLLAARAIGHLSAAESAIDLIQTIACALERMHPMRSTAAALICELAEIGLWCWPEVFGKQPGSLPELGITETRETTKRRALLHLREGRFELAHQQLTKAIANGDQDPVTLFNRGMLNYRLQRNEDAILDFTAAIAGDADYEKAYSQRGVAQAALHRHDFAVDDFTQAIALNPEEPFNYAQRARSYQALGRLDLARKDAAQAAALSTEGHSEPSLVLRHSSEPRQTPPPHAAALAALEAIDAIETIADVLITQAMGSAGDDAQVLAVNGLAAIERWETLKHLASDAAIPPAARIEALLRLRPLDAEAAGIAERIALDCAIAQHEREVAITALAQSADVERLLPLLRALGEIPNNGRLDLRPESAMVAARALITLRTDARTEVLIALARDPSLPPFVVELLGECLWVLDMTVEATEMLARIANQNDTPASVRWSAIYALAQFDRLAAIEGTLRQIDSPSHPEGELKRRVRALLLDHPETKRVELEVTRELENARRALMDTSSCEELRTLIDQHPILLAPGFARYAETSCALAADEPRLQTRLGWYRAMPRVQAAMAVQSFRAAATPTAMNQATKQHPIMLSQDFAEHLQGYLQEAQHGDRRANELRLKWLLELPRTAEQRAFDAVRRCPDQPAMRALAKAYPLIRKRAFVSAMESHLPRMSPAQQASARQRLEWLRGCALGPAETEVACALTLHHTAHRSKEALELVTRIIESEPEYADAWFTRGVILGESDDHEAALVDFTRSVDLDPTVCLAHQVRAQCLFNLGRDLEAITSANKAIELDPERPEPYHIRAQCHLRAKQWHEAERDLTVCIDQGQEDWALLYARASCRTELGQKDEALADLEAVLTQQPALPEALFFKATLLCQLDLLPEARRCLSELRRLGAADSKAYAVLYGMIMLPPGDETNDLLSALWQVESPEEMAQLASAVPLLLDAGFPGYVEAHVAPQASFQGLPPLGERLAWLRELPNQRQRIARACFGQARTQEDIVEAAHRFPQLASPASIRELESLIPSAPAEQHAALREKIEWLRNAPLPAHHRAFFAFEESQSLDELKRAAKQHPILLEPEFHENLRRSIDLAPEDLRAILTQRLALLTQWATT